MGKVEANAQEIIIPSYFSANERIPIADTSQISRLRFITIVDFPPFSFLDQTGRLTGFHVDLARQVCDSLNIIERCQIQALAWDELEDALEKGQGEAIIAGLAISPQSRQKYLFSRAYLELPARFIGHREQLKDNGSLIERSVAKVGVVKDTSHEAMLKSWFPQLKGEPFASQDDLFTAMSKKEIDGAFGDGLQFSFWLDSQNSKDCCQFDGGPYRSQSFLGEGLAIAVGKDKKHFIDAINYGLYVLHKNGGFEELYLRYFPNGIY